MTVYNHLLDENGKDHWKRTVVKGVQWRNDKKELTVSGGVQTETRVESITVDFQRDYGNKRYIPLLEFDKLVDKTDYWTLNARDAMDLVILGEIEKEISDNYSFQNLKADFPDCRTVTVVTDNRNRDFLKHIKVVAK